ncbi:MAG TPA: tRNA (adenosine(37)-N6)-threonylcarbamoyltransferase complex dimerization subunit type 1 TsaB [Thermomicrobiales bacterium]|nr:tRNA (adenosine(37)-N6)-threonylcarbamoyltransferase complex dimerization subunit type 1 TsaB [Thermomicrobiales bacterium]
MTLTRRWTLAVDTATDQAGIAFLHETVVAERSWPGGRQQTTMLLPQVRSLATELGIDLSTLALVVVTIGPGSFTGLRVGLSVAKGLVLANGCALVGVPTLDVTAAPWIQAGVPCVAVAPAGRSRVVWATYTREVPAIPVNSSFPTFLAAVARYPDRVITGELDAEQRASLGSAGHHVISPASGVRRPGVLAEMGYQRWLDGQLDDPVSLEPAYLHGRPNPR